MATKRAKKKAVKRSAPAKGAVRTSLQKRAARDPLRSTTERLEESFEQGSSTTLSEFRSKINWA